MVPFGVRPPPKVPWKASVPAPGASKVVMVCAYIEVEIARATRMVAAGWSFLFAK